MLNIIKSLFSIRSALILSVLVILTTSAGYGGTFSFANIADPHIDPLYEAAIEATEEAVLNAMFCSGGMTGREGRFSPALPQDQIIELLNQGRDIHVSD